MSKRVINLAKIYFYERHKKKTSLFLGKQFHRNERERQESGAGEGCKGWLVLCSVVMVCNNCVALVRFDTSSQSSLCALSSCRLSVAVDGSQWQSMAVPIDANIKMGSILFDPSAHRDRRLTMDPLLSAFSTHGLIYYLRN